MAESSLRHYITKGFEKSGCVAQPHEDTCMGGISDLSFTLLGGVSGWMELKSLDGWPVRLNTTVKIRHLTDAQVEFLKERGQRGAPCYIVIRAFKDYCFLPWQFGDMLYRGGMTASDIIFVSHYWQYSVNWDELITCINQDFVDNTSWRR